MQIQFNNLTTQDKLKAHLIQTGCYTAAENERIYHKWFEPGPRYLFRAVNQKYHLTEQIVCDAGCGYGMNLVYCAPGSYGIDMASYQAQFAESIGLQIYQRDIIYDDLSDLPKADVVWNSAVLEHVDSPHIFLRKLNSLLKPGGLLALYVPIIPPFFVLRHIPRLEPHITGHLYSDHINGFTPSTLRFFAERAGFQTVEVSPFYPGMLALFNRLYLLNSCVYVGRKIEGWQYPRGAERQTANNKRGYVWRT